MKKIITNIIIRIKQLFNKEESYSLVELVDKLADVDIEEIKANIQVGDIVNAAMPLSLDALSEIEKNHRHRPYLIMRVNVNSCTAYPGTSNEEKINPQTSFFVDRNKYHVWKNGYFTVNKSVELPYENMIEILDQISLEDKVQINEIITKANLSHNNLMFEEVNNISVGAIVTRGTNLYYVYRIKDNQADIYKLKNKKTGYPIGFRGKLYYIDPNNIKTIESSKYTVIGRSSNSMIKKLNQYWASRKKSIKKNLRYTSAIINNHQYRFPLGTRFKLVDETYIYLYSLNGNDYGFDERDILNACPPIRNLNNLKYYNKDEILNITELVDAIERIVLRSKNYQWLYEDAIKLKREYNLAEK